MGNNEFSYYESNCHYFILYCNQYKKEHYLFRTGGVTIRFKRGKSSPPHQTISYTQFYYELIDILFRGCLLDKISFCLFVDTCV